VQRHDYVDFDLLVQRAAGGGFEARVLRSPAGETGAVAFPAPFSDLELENFLLKIGRPRALGVRGMGSRESVAVRDFGGRLFQGVFRGAVRDRLSRSLSQVEERGLGLRLRLRLADCPELADLPWECLYDTDQNRHLALSDWTPLIRYLDLPGRMRALAVSPPLRVLLLVSSPTDLARLDVEQEFENLHQAIADLSAAGQVIVDRLPAATLSALQQQLRREEYHVFHFVGHGGYDSASEGGVLLFEGPTGRGQEVSGQDLATLLYDYRTLRLVVLNSCEGARGGLTDPYSGTAQTLVQQGIPAVIAMQFEITDEASITFSHTFYAALSDGYPVEAATAEARKAIKNSLNPMEWATPVLYLRALEGDLFTLSGSAPPSDRVPGRDQSRGQSDDVPATNVATADPRDGRVVAVDAGGSKPEADLSGGVQADHPEDPDVQRRPVEEPQRSDVSLLIDDVRRLYGAQNWAAVVDAGQRLASLDASEGDPEGMVTHARDVLAEEELAGLYAKGMRELDESDWSAAFDSFNSIQRVRPGYRDVDALIVSIQGSQQDQEHEQRVDDVQEQVRRPATAENWPAGLSVSSEASAVDPPDAERLRTYEEAAREQLKEHARDAGGGVTLVSRTNVRAAVAAFLRKNRTAAGAVLGALALIGGATLAVGLNNGADPPTVSEGSTGTKTLTTPTGAATGTEPVGDRLDDDYIVWTKYRESTGDFAVFTVRSDGTGERPLTAWQPGKPQANISPDRKQVVYVAATGFLHSVATTGQPTDHLFFPKDAPVDADCESLKRPAWSPHGYFIAPCGSCPETKSCGHGKNEAVYQVDFNGHVRRLVPGAKRPTVSPDGRFVAYELEGGLFLTDLDGNAPPQELTPPNPTNPDSEPAWSHDGILAFGRELPDGGAIFTMQVLRGSELVPKPERKAIRRYAGNEDASTPSWSPTGNRLVFRLGRNATSDLFLMDGNGGDLHRLFKRDPGNSTEANFYPTWRTW
jgi:Tol biopolymer transport system component